MGDRTYAGPNERQVERLAAAFRAIDGAKVPKPLDCDDIAGRFRLFAAECYATNWQCRSESIAIGEVWRKGHSLNVVVLSTGEVRTFDVAAVHLWKTDKVSDFETNFHRFIELNHPEIGKGIVAARDITPEIEETLKAAITEFKRSIAY